MTSAPRQPRIAILGIDTFAPKNLLQLRCVNRLGFYLDVFTADSRGSSSALVAEPNTVHRLSASGTARLLQVTRFLRSHRDVLHHVEVYPGGRFAPMYVFLARSLGIPVLTVERGDLVDFDEASPLLRFGMTFCYRMANAVWYREPYQGRTLESLRSAPRFFLPNAVEAQPVSATVRDVDFLWANRLTPQRHLAWFLDALDTPPFGRARAIVAGILPDAGVTSDIRALQQEAKGRERPGVQILPFGDVQSLYQRSRFFVLPSDIVFANNALLEAMVHGVVPIVSDVEDARSIVDDGVSGFISPHSPEGFAQTMERAWRTASPVIESMAHAARTSVLERFDAGRWCRDLGNMYASLRSAGGTTA
jgi:glycosyltransferase involved in cell wall biosynthesis